ncbi:hypothetical protein L3049_18525 [Labilibaculum sp. DW002]|uniref:Lipoprotein n=1 Tax=Paralabilibaculum antarcticum TaxID=2912572 RepID=A0ABT5VX35_9BACT|nr:hypothetical protein [Labilibaculum sp. DW002]MDE5419989.1 hypothetical protein [Labilibaculum sp. DW002]
MKLLFAFIILSSAFMSCNSEKNKFDKTVDPILNPDLIKEFHSVKYLDSLLVNNGVKKIGEINVRENLDSCKIIFNTMTGWNDPGDFLNIQIVDSKNNETFRLNNLDGWMKCIGNYDLPETIKSVNLDKSEIALLIENKTGKQLVIFGYSYASEPGLMTIIDLFPKPQVIFNTQFDLRSISSISKNGYLNFIGGTTLLNHVVLNMELMKIQKH